MKHGNCFVTSIYLLWKLRKWSGNKKFHWWVRSSDHIAGWHWGVETRDRRYVLHYEPLEAKPLPTAIWHKIWYKGELKRGDIKIERGERC